MGAPWARIQEKFEYIKDSYRLEKCNDVVNAAINDTGPHHSIDKLWEESDEYIMDIEANMDELRR